MLTDAEKLLFVPDTVSAMGKTIHEVYYGIDGHRYMEFTDGTVLVIQPAVDGCSDPYVLMGVHPDRTYEYSYACLHLMQKITREEWDRRCEEDTERKRDEQKEDRRRQYEKLKREFEPTPC